MATWAITRTWTVPAAGENTIGEIINETTRDNWVTYISMRAKADNTGDITWEDSDGEVGGYLEGGEAHLLGDDTGDSRYANWVLKGTEDDVLYLTIGTSSDAVS